MNEQPRVPRLVHGESEKLLDYESSEERRVLFRVLADSLVRELRNSGHHGPALIGFVSQLMQAVTDAGFEEEPVPSGSFQPVASMSPALELEKDQWGRPSITGERVVLRPPEEADRSTLEQWRRDPVLMDSLAPQVLDDIVRQLPGAPQADRVDLLVCDPETAVPFGAVSLHKIEAESMQAEVAKMIGDPRFRGKGLAGAATLLLLKYGFSILGLNRIYLRTLGGNLKNIRLNEGLGFRFEGVLREALVKDGKALDVVLMGLLRSEFEALHRAGEGEYDSSGPVKNPKTQPHFA